MTSGLTRFGGPRTVVCNLGTSGSLPAHQPGVAYSGTFSVTNRVGEVTAELVSATPALPAGWSLQVNQATGVVTLAWPAAAPVSAPPLPNLDFEAGAANWLLGNAWIIDGAGLQDGGTQAGRYRGAGQSSMRHAQAVPVTPGQSITASARISKGTTRADFAGGAVVLEWLTAAGAPLDFSVGNVVNTGTAAFQTSTVTATAPAGAGLVRLAVSATRDIKGRASDSVYVDNVTWNHAYTLPGAPVTDYAVVIRVLDGRGCQAVATRVIGNDSPSLVDARLSTFNLNGLPLTTNFNVPIPTTSKVGDVVYLYTMGAGVGPVQASLVRTPQSTFDLGLYGALLGFTTPVTARVSGAIGGARVLDSTDIANGFLEVSSTSGGSDRTVACVAIKIPKDDFHDIGDAATNRHQQQLYLGNSDTPAPGFSSVAHQGGGSRRVHLFAILRTTGGGLSVSSYPLPRLQMLHSGVGTTGDNGFAQDIALCYNVVTGTSFSAAAFTYSGIPTLGGVSYDLIAIRGGTIVSNPPA